MTSRERVKAAVAFQPVDRVPACFFDGGVWISKRRNISLEGILEQPDAGASILIETYRETESDIAWVGNGMHSLALRALGVKADYSRVGAPAETATMLGDIADIHSYDASQLRAALENDASMQRLLQQIRGVKAAVGADMYVGSVIGSPFSAAAVMVGVQKFMELLFDEDEYLPALYDFAVAFCVETAQLLIGAGVDLICLGDPVASGALISQGMFEEYALPLEKRAFDAIHGADIKLLHICGNTLPRLKSLKTLDIDGFSLDSVDLAQAMQIADGHYAIFGNLSPFAVLESKTPHEVAEISRALCETAGKNGGFVLMPGCDLAPATPLENITAMIRAPRG